MTQEDIGVGIIGLLAAIVLIMMYIEAAAEQREFKRTGKTPGPRTDANMFRSSRADEIKERFQTIDREWIFEIITDVDFILRLSYHYGDDENLRNVFALAEAFLDFYAGSTPEEIHTFINLQK